MFGIIFWYFGICRFFPFFPFSFTFFGNISFDRSHLCSSTVRTNKHIYAFGHRQRGRNEIRIILRTHCDCMGVDNILSCTGPGYPGQRSPPLGEGLGDARRGDGVHLIHLQHAAGSSSTRYNPRFLSQIPRVYRVLHAPTSLVCTGYSMPPPPGPV